MGNKNKIHHKGSEPKIAEHTDLNLLYSAKLPTQKWFDNFCVKRKYMEFSC